MRRIIEAFAFMLIVLSSGAFINQIKDGGAREQGLENSLSYAGPLNKLPLIWLAGILFVIAVLFLTKNLKKIKIAWPMATLIAFCFASAMWADFPRVAFQSTLFIAAAYLLINLQVALYGGQATLRFLSLVFFIILVCSLIAALIVPSYGIAVGSEHEGRWQGVFEHKNSLGNFSAMSFLFFVWRYQQQKSKSVLVGALLSVVLVIASQSSTALANMVIVIFVSALLSFKFTEKITYRLRYVLIVFLIALSFFAILVAIGFQEFSIFEKDSSFSNRNLIWIYILAKVAASPWIGYGMDQLGALTNKNSAEFFSNVGFLVGSSHNGFLETTFSLGYIGLIMMLWVLMSQLSNKRGGIGFPLLFGYIVLFIVLNTFEARMISFNIYFIGLMYVMAIADAMATPTAKVGRTKIRSTYQLSAPIRTADRI